MATNPSAVAIKAASEGNLGLLKSKRRRAPPSPLFLLKIAHGPQLPLSLICYTPIFRAANEGKVSVMRYLLDHGGDPAIPDASGFTPLHMATENGHHEAVELLLSRGVDVDPLNSRLAVPLHSAAMKSHDKSLKLLLERGADPNRVFLSVYSPLLMACEARCSLECVKLLVEAGADLNFIMPYGSSPLIAATKEGLTDIVRFLLEAGADPNICDDGPGVGADMKIRGNEAFAKGDYSGAIYFYGLAMFVLPLDATLFANRSLCWLRVRDGNNAVSDAKKCREIRPRWSKAWYREGAALMLLKNYKGAADAFAEALKLDPASDEIKAAPLILENCREATEALRCAARSDEQKNP
ncbi:hypothetical protein EJB05_49452, partial [Eragrostis curvula]